MGITQSRVEPHWNYFLAVERDLERLSRFVEFDTRNFECFSIELARLLLTASAEVDVVCKQVCRAANSKSKADNIIRYRKEILVAFPRLPTFGVVVPRFGLALHPWDQWRQKDDRKAVPLWWTAHNKVKHARHAEYHQATLKNALNAVAGLFVMVVHLYPQQAESGELVPSPQLLRPDEEHLAGVTVTDAFEGGFNYVLGRKPRT